MLKGISINMRAPKLPSFFKSRTPSSFYIEPRFYDEKKDKLEERKKKIEEQIVHEKKNNPNQKTSFDFKLERKKKESKGYSSRLIIILVCLLAIVYIIFKYLDKLS